MHDANPERIRSALSFLDPHDRKQWVDMAFAIKDELGEAGFEIWDEWGSQHQRPASEIKATWKSAKPGGRLKAGTLIHRAKEAGWQDDTQYKKPSKAVIEARRKAAEERAAAYQAEEAAAQEAAAERAATIWGNAQPAGEHPYLQRKGVQAHGLRVGDWSYEYADKDTGEINTATVSGCLLVPLQDRKRNLHSLQAIPPNAAQRKLYLKDGAKKGHFYPIGKPKKDGQSRPIFLLGEGYATCASAHEATGHMVLVCFDTSNLAHVARLLRESQPEAVILFLADNDCEQSDGKNPGVEAARAAAQAVSGLVVIPVLSAEPDRACDFNDLHLADGIESVAAFIDAALVPAAPVAPGPVEAPPAEPEPAPPAPTLPIEDDDLEGCDPSGHFTVLGYDRGTYYVFQHEQRQIHGFKGGEMASDATMLMLAPLDWWEGYFPSDDKKAGSINKKKWLDWFFRVAPRRGIYDISRLRGRGAWVDDGRIVFHHGSHLSVDGARVDVTKVVSRYVYELSRTLPAPADIPLSDADGANLVEVARLFRWSKPGAAALLSGWTFLAPVCGALRWRPHIWINGGAGSGKSTILNEYVAAMLGGVKVFAQGASSEAGIRQKLKADALPVLFDESEQNNDAEKKRIEGVLALIRQASTESEAQTLKGTLSGESSTFHVRSMFCLASIQVGMENKADLDRLTKLTLQKADDSEEASAKWEAIKERLYKIRRDDTLPSRLLRRAIDLLPVIHQNITVFIEAAAKKFGTQRLGDQYGTLLAGCWCLSSSAVATPKQAEAMINAYDWAEFTEAGEEDDPEKALRTLLEAKINHKGEALTVGTLVTLAANLPVEGTSIDAKVALRIIREHGINFAGKALVFQNGSTALRKLVADTPFATDLRGQLLRVKGAKPHTPTRFGAGGTQRCIGVPLDLVLPSFDEPAL